MAQILPWVALALSGLVLGHAAARGAKVARGGLGPYFGAAAALLVVGALVTLAGGAPWSTGQGLWPGFLLGGLSVLAAAFLGRRSRFAGEGGAFLAAGAQIAAAGLGVSVVILLYPVLRHGILDTFGGLALGAITAGLVLSAATLSGDEESGAAATFGALATLALTTATFLAAFHRDPLGLREWLPLPALLTATASAALTARGVLGGAGPLLSLGVIGAPLLGMGWLIGHRLHGSPAFFFAVLIGLAVYGAVAWLERSDPDDQRPGLRADTGLLAALLLLGGAALAFRERQGYGLALAALCGVFVWGATGAGTDRRSVLLAGGVALLLLTSLYRVFTETNAYERGFQPDFLYYYVALIAGAVLPALLAGSLFRGAPANPSGSLARIGLAGGAAVLAPLAVWLLVGERPQAALLVGLAVGAGFLLSRHVTGPRGAAEVSTAGLLALGVGWTTIQFTHLLQPLAMGTRMQRVTILAVVGAIALAAVILTALLERAKSAAPAVRESGE